MPYRLHTIGAEPSTGTLYPTKPEALAVRQDGQTVSYVATPEESAAWRDRERIRFIDNVYAPVPWDTDIRWRLGAQAVTMRGHYAHTSLKDPGMIAYTPDEAYGVQDRQLRVKPGRYLEQFAKDMFSAEQVAEYIAAAKATTEELQLAKTPDDIARVYTAKGGPTSCMDRGHFDFDDTPVRVYGDSDLAVAYLGSIAGDDRTQDHIGARCVVWPERKIYSRAYGDTATLETVLRIAGYAKGGLDGAKVRAVRDSGDIYVMPYVDGIDGAELRGRWFTLGSGSYNCQCTDGRTGSCNTCSNCGDSCDEDESYCSGCADSHYYCDGCSEDYFDEDYHRTDRGTYCDSCYSDHSHDCVVCETAFNELEYSRRTWQNRNQELCDDCESTHTTCEDCGEYVKTDTVDAKGLCEDCTPKQHRALPRPQGRLLRRHTATTGMLTVFAGGSQQTVAVYREIDGLAVHQTVRSDGRPSDTWTVTHKLTGLAAMLDIPTLDKALKTLERLHVASLDWAFDSSETMPAATRQAASRITRELRESAWV